MALLILQYALLVPAALPFVGSDSLATGIARIWGLGIRLVSFWALVTTLRLGQGSSRAARASLMDDASLIVDKRFGLGQTLNFANHSSWVVLALMLAPLVVLVIFVG